MNRLKRYVQNATVQSLFQSIKAVFKNEFNWNVDSLTLELTTTPIFNNGTPNPEMPLEHFGGCWTHHGVIYINPDLNPVMDHYGTDYSLKAFTCLIIAHECAHEVYNKILTQDEKKHYHQLTQSFRSHYLDTFDANSPKLNEERFCEYIAYQVVNSLNEV